MVSVDLALLMVQRSDGRQAANGQRCVKNGQHKRGKRQAADNAYCQRTKKGGAHNGRTNQLIVEVVGLDAGHGELDVGADGRGPVINGHRGGEKRVGHEGGQRVGLTLNWTPVALGPSNSKW